MENENIYNAEQIHRHLPEDIVVEILSRLPVKSLLRYKSVCRSWRSFISSKNFIKTHLQNSKKKETFAHHRIISTSLASSECQRTLRAYSLYSLLFEPVTHPISLDFFPMHSSENLSIVGSCNGLMCVLVDRYRFFLLNPSTREFMELPDFFNGTNLRKKRCSISGYGFGFDEISGDYKVNALFCIPPRTSVARVYSFKADSWGCNMFFKNGWEYGISGKFVSGKLHWIRDWLYSTPKWEIVCLDLKSETFGTVERPGCLGLDGYVGPSLGVLKGCLCVLLDNRLTDLGFDIWILSEYGVEDSWAKFMTVSYPFDSCCTYLRPLFVLANDKVLFLYGSHFFIYNPKYNCARRLHTVDFGIDHICDAQVYTESLVSLVSDVVIKDDGDVKKKRKRSIYG